MAKAILLFSVVKLLFHILIRATLCELRSACVHLKQLIGFKSALEEQFTRKREQEPLIQENFANNPMRFLGHLGKLVFFFRKLNHSLSLNLVKQTLQLIINSNVRPKPINY